MKKVLFVVAIGTIIEYYPKNIGVENKKINYNLIKRLQDDFDIIHPVYFIDNYNRNADLKDTQYLIEQIGSENIGSNILINFNRGEVQRSVNGVSLLAESIYSYVKKELAYNSLQSFYFIDSTKTNLQELSSVLGTDYVFHITKYLD